MRQSSVVIAVLIAVGLPASCGIGVAIGGGGNTASAPAPTVTVTAPGKASKAKPVETVTAAPEAPKDAFGDGMRVVGDDIPAGTYRTTEDVTGDCFWSTYKSGTNGAEVIQIEHPGGGSPRVTVKRGQDFKSQGCGDWALVS